MLERSTCGDDLEGLALGAHVLGGLPLGLGLLALVFFLVLWPVGLVVWLERRLQRREYYRIRSKALEKRRRRGRIRETYRGAPRND